MGFPFLLNSNPNKVKKTAVEIIVNAVPLLKKGTEKLPAKIIMYIVTPNKNSIIPPIKIETRLFILYF